MTPAWDSQGNTEFGIELSSILRSSGMRREVDFWEPWECDLFGLSSPLGKVHKTGLWPQIKRSVPLRPTQQAHKRPDTSRRPAHLHPTAAATFQPRVWHQAERKKALSWDRNQTYDEGRRKNRSKGRPGWDFLLEKDFLIHCLLVLLRQEPWFWVSGQFSEFILEWAWPWDQPPSVLPGWFSFLKWTVVEMEGREGRRAEGDREILSTMR